VQFYIEVLYKTEMKQYGWKKMKKLYSAFGLVIESELGLTELLPATGQADVQIMVGKAPDRLENPQVKTPWYEAAPGRFLLRVEGIAKYYVENGDRIVIEPHPAAQPETIRVFLLHPAVAALLQQRDYLVLHGAAAVVDGKAVVLVGNSSVGKTAIALTLFDRGYELLGDEICAIKLQEGKPVVVPGVPQLNVWRDTLKRADHDVERYQPIRQEIEKYAVPIHDQFGKSAVALGNIVLMKQHNLAANAWEPLKGAAGFEQLMRSAYFVETVANQAQHFKIGAAIMQNTHLGRVTFNDQPYQIDKVTDFILGELR
jgi:hypothetical protein